MKLCFVHKCLREGHKAETGKRFFSYTNAFVFRAKVLGDFVEILN